MKVMVAGETKFIGKQIIRKLNENGHEILVLTRNPNTARFHIPAHCNTIFWNPEKYSLPPSTLKGVDAVINLAGEGVAEGRWSSKRKQALIQSRIVSTRQLVNAMTYMRNKPKVFISASAIGFYGSREDELLDENSNKGHGFLSEIWQRWEDKSLIANDLVIRTIAFRIGMVLGHDGGALDKMLPPFKFGVGGNLGNGSQWMSWIHIADLVNMIIYALENPNVKGIYNAVSPNPVVNKSFTKVLGKILNRPTLFTVPKFILRIALGELSELLLGSQRVSSQKITDGGFRFNFPELNSALQEICGHPYHEINLEQLVPQPLTRTFFSRKLQI